MLRVVQSRSSAGLKDYFTGGLAGGDFSIGEELSVSWWSGRGAELLGLRGEVTRKDFAALADNVHPGTGEQLTPRLKANRRVASDFNFNGPKSHSIMALIAGDHRLIDVFSDSVQFTMRAIERYVATRVRVDGKNEDRITGNLVVANFLHVTTRPVDGIPDPHVHVHCVVFNATHDSVENRWKAVQLGDVVKQSPYFQALFLSDLAKRVMSLGYGVTTTGPAWEIDGVPRDVIVRYSRRSQIIEQAALRDGINSAKEKAGYGARTRERKSKRADKATVERDWRDRVTDDEFQDLRNLRNRPVTPLSPKLIDEAVRLAVLRTFERSAMVEESVLLANVVKACPGHLTVAEIRSRYEDLKIIVRDDDGKRSVTTRDVLKAEKTLVDTVAAGRGTLRPLLIVKAETIGRLMPGEVEAIKRVLGSQDLLTIVRSDGVGQQAAFLQRLASISQLYAGHSFVALGATGASVTGELREAGFKSATTVAEFLRNEKLHDPVRKSVLWVSDAHRLPVAILQELVDFASRNTSRVVLSGDRLSRGAIFGGNVLDILERHGGIVPVDLRGSRAQKGESARVVGALLDGRVRDAERVLDQAGRFRSVGPEELGFQAGRALAEQLTKRAKGLVVAPTRELAEAATAACRASLKGKARIQRERLVPHLLPQYLSTIDKARSSSYKSGMVVRFVKASGSFKPGQDWTVTGVNTLGYVEVRRGLKLSVLPKHRPERFDVYTKKDLAIGVGDRIRVTKTVRTRAVIDIPLGLVSRKHSRPHRILRAGSVHRVKDFTVTGHLVLDNGMILKKGGVFEYAYAQTTGAAMTHGVDHVVLAVPKNDEAFMTAEQLAHAASVGRKSVTVVTDRSTLEGLRTQGPPRPSSLDVQADLPDLSLLGKAKEFGERLTKTAFGVTAPSREYERTMEL